MILAIRNLIKRCRVTRSYADAKAFPYAQVEFNGKVIDVEVIMPYGLAARIPVNALGHKFLLNGDEGDPAAIFNTPTKRFKLAAEGEVAVGNPLVGSKTVFKADGSIETTNPAGASVVIAADGSIRLGNSSGYLELKSDGTVDINGIIFDTHVHGGVQPGGGSTGGPA